MVKEPTLIPIVGLSHNNERGGGELVLSFSLKIKTQNESNSLRQKIYHGNLKEKTTNSNSLANESTKLIYLL